MQKASWVASGSCATLGLRVRSAEPKSELKLVNHCVPFGVGCELVGTVAVPWVAGPAGAVNNVRLGGEECIECSSAVALLTARRPRRRRSQPEGKLNPY